MFSAYPHLILIEKEYGGSELEVEIRSTNQIVNKVLSVRSILVFDFTFKLGLALRPLSVAILMSCPTPL